MNKQKNVFKVSKWNTNLTKKFISSESAEPRNPGHLFWAAHLSDRQFIFVNIILNSVEKAPEKKIFF